jgi:hypothetical protein
LLEILHGSDSAQNFTYNSLIKWLKIEKIQEGWSISPPKHPKWKPLGISGFWGGIFKLAKFGQNR